MDPFIGEVRLFPYNFIPSGWLLCNGALAPIPQYTPLFALLGTTYGGNGTTTFGLPNLNGRIAMGAGSGPYLTPRTRGEETGSETVQLLQSNLPMHTHNLHAAPGSTALTAVNEPGTNAIPSQPTRVKLYDDTANLQLAPQTLSPVGGSTPISNLQPYQTLMYCIAWDGIFPPHP